jgi:hypothetical protein
VGDVFNVQQRPGAAAGHFPVIDTWPQGIDPVDFKGGQNDHIVKYPFGYFGLNFEPLVLVYGCQSFGLFLFQPGMLDSVVDGADAADI